MLYDVPAALRRAAADSSTGCARYTLAPPGLVLRSVLRSTEALDAGTPGHRLPQHRVTSRER